jgi:hypothetical protein
MSRGGAVGSVILLLPEDNEEVMVVLMHCDPTASEWIPVERGGALSQHAGHGVGAPHLHLEINCTERAWRELSGHVDTGTVTDEAILRRASRAGLVPDKVLAAVRAQRRRWGITQLLEDGIETSGLPEYRHSRYSRVGKGTTYRVNPERFLQEAEYV